jgi:colanic acid/amylovoran biosynthesis glycosyltransferase
VRVAHIVHHYGKLSESFIPDALEELERAGAEAWVGTMSVQGRDTYPFPPDERLLVCPPPGLVRRAVDRLRGRSAGRFAEQLARRLQPLRPAVVHAQFGWGAVTGVAVAERLGVPAVATFHGTDVTVVPVERADGAGWRGPAGHGYEGMFARLGTAIAVSDFIARKLRALGYEGPIDVIPAGVRLDRLPPRADDPPGEPRIVYVGRLNPQKGLSVLLEAMPRILEAAPAARLEVIGGGPSGAELEALADRLGVAPHTTFRGALPRREDVLEGLRRAHVCVMPSRAMPDGAAEGSPVVTKEAQAVGVPLVATDTGGIAETVPPEHRPDLVPGDDPPALADAVTRLLLDPEARVERARRAREWVEREFDATALARRTVRLYERLATASS